jgi:hypothetical protein
VVESTISLKRLAHLWPAAILRQNVWIRSKWAAAGLAGGAGPTTTATTSTTSHTTTTTTTKQSGGDFPPPPPDLVGFLATCKQQMPATGVYHWWPRGPGCRSALVDPHVGWTFMAEDVGAGVCVSFRLKGTEFVAASVGAAAGAVGAAERQSAAKVPLEATVPAHSTDAALDTSFVTLQGVLVGVREPPCVLY